MYQHWMTARDTYITDEKEAKRFHEELVNLERTHKVRVETRFKGEVREWLMTSPDKFTFLCFYVVNRLGVKVKVQVVDKVATGYTLQPLKY